MQHVDAFVEHRGLLLAVAYRMLGSVSEAEDIVSDAYLRWHAVDPDRVENPRSYLAVDRDAAVHRPPPLSAGPA